MGATAGEPLSPERLMEVRVRVPQHVAYKVFPAETVVLNLQSGKYHSINPTGGRFLLALEQTGSVRRALRHLEEEFPDRDPEALCEDLAEFCNRLAACGLIELVEP